MKFNKKELFFILFGFYCIYRAFNIHAESGINNYHSQLWADPSGYYVYLPATFIYGFHASNFPADIESKIGYGFSLDKTTNKVKTKYTSGIAILFLPFFLIAHLIAIVFSLDPSGFSPIYYKMTDVGAVFYLTLGLYFLWQFLCFYFSKKISTLTIALLFFATNLYYYSISKPFYSHIYSFFLFCLFLYLLKKYFIDSSPKLRHIFLFSIISALIVLIRPTNILFIIAALFLDIKSVGMFKNRMMLFLNVKSMLLLVLAGWIVFLPQILYWHFLTNNYIVYSYKGEGFFNWNSPKILEVLFSTNNGLIVWTPLFVLIIISMFWTVFKKKKNSITVFVSFFILLYLCASWHIWWFGGSFGQRSFVEYLAFFSIPVAYGFEYLHQLKSRITQFLIYTAILFCVNFNLQMIYNYDVCFFGGTWDWKEYRNYFDKSKMFGFTSTKYTLYTDFEGKIWNPKISGLQTIVKSKNSFSGEYVSKIDSVNIYSSGCESMMNTIGHHPLKTADISFQSYFYNSADNFKIVCQFDSSQQQVLFYSKKLSYFSPKIHQWQKINTRFYLPITMTQYNIIKLFVWNTGKDSMLIDDLKIVFKY